MNAVSKPRWFHLTPSWLLVALLPIWGGLFLSDRFHWLPKGYPVLLALASLFVALLILALWFATAAVFHWRFQYGIRTLLLVVLLTSVGMSWLAVKMQQARRQREAVDEISKLGGFVFYDDEDEQPTEPSWRRSLFGGDFFHEVAAVWVSDNDETHEFDAGLEHLKAVTRASVRNYYTHGLPLDD